MWFTGLLSALSSSLFFHEPSLNTSTQCAHLSAPSIPGATILNITSTVRPESNFAKVAYCAVDVYLSHHGVNDEVHITTWLPLSGWNGRFQGTGGGGYLAGMHDLLLPRAINAGYAASSTDAGERHSDDGTVWASDPELFKNFAYRSVHEMTVVGKALTESVYGIKPHHSYWRGCSTGGRQGYMEAQRYPHDYNGILAAAPAINWDRFLVAELWPYVVQTNEGEYVSQCVFNTFTSAATAACALDGSGKDGMTLNPLTCHFDPETLIGSPVSCGETSHINAMHASIFKKITMGPVNNQGKSLWYGIPLGANFSGLGTDPPFAIASSWIRNFVLREPEFNLSSVTYESFPSIFASSRRFNSFIGTDDPDLSAFRDAGGKLLTWHGWGDQLIFPQGSIDYRRRVDAVMGGTQSVDDFLRLFLVPGMGHCRGSIGVSPTDPLTALVDWVEKGVAPETLPAAGPVGTRDLCRWPKELQYKGTGDVADANSWTCVRYMDMEHGRSVKVRLSTIAA